MDIRNSKSESSKLINNRIDNCLKIVLRFRKTKKRRNRQMKKPNLNQAIGVKMAETLELV